MLSKVMLVDDEILVRLGIRSVIDWEKHGFVYVGDASDGIEALEGIERYRPDILLTDIVMPNMNGLELIEKAKRIAPDMRIIVLSSHNEYEFLRQAMKMGVDDYLLKASMKPEELLELLQETASKIAAGKELRKEDASLPPTEADARHKLEKTFRYWLEGAASADPSESSANGKREEADHCGWIWHGEHVLMLLHIHPPSLSSSIDAEVYQTLTNLTELELNKWKKGSVIPYNDHSLILLVPLSAGESGEAEIVDSMGKDIISALKRFLGISVTIGVSGIFAGQAELKQAYIQAYQAVQQYFLDHKETVYNYSAMKGLPAEAEPLLTKEIGDELRRQIELLDEEGLKRTVANLFRRMREIRPPVDYNIQVCLELLHHIHSGLKKYDPEEPEEHDAEPPLYKQVIGLQSVHEAEEWFGRFIGLQFGRVREALGRTYREEIRHLILKMKESYADNWSLSQAARMTNMSESYLSYLFKKETQIGFTAYLNQIRVEQAAEYLRETQWPGYLIAEKVGYDNINYFGRVFKKMMGVSPQQYRNQLQNKSNEGSSLARHEAINRDI